jgi:hypothetical protein
MSPWSDAYDALRHRTVSVIIAFLSVLAWVASPTFADKGDKQGWSLSSDPRKRVFLKFVPENDGPRILVLGCLRDVDSFIVLSEQDLGVGPGQDVVLTLQNGAAQYVVQGKFDPNGSGVGKAGFESEIDMDAKTLRQIRLKLLPVLEGNGAIELTVGSTSRELPVEGLRKALNGFKSVCFGQR